MAEKLLHEGLDLSPKLLVACTNKSVKSCGSCALRETYETEYKKGELPDDLEEKNPLALVPFQKLDDDDSCYSIVMGDSKQTKPGWWLLRQVFQPRKHTTPKFSQKNTFGFQRALRQPSCHSSAVVHPDQKQINIDQTDDFTLDGESGAIVLFGSATSLPPPTLCSDVSLPEELLVLREKYSSSCRLYSLQELASATANFSPGKLPSLQLLFPSFYSSNLLEISSDMFS